MLPYLFLYPITSFLVCPVLLSFFYLQALPLGSCLEKGLKHLFHSSSHFPDIRSGNPGTSEGAHGQCHKLHRVVVSRHTV